jgi:hypothetical protein
LPEPVSPVRSNGQSTWLTRAIASSNRRIAGERPTTRDRGPTDGTSEVFAGADFEEMTEFIWKRLPNDHRFDEGVSTPGDRATVIFS